MQNASASSTKRKRAKGVEVSVAYEIKSKQSEHIAEY